MGAASGPATTAGATDDPDCSIRSFPNRPRSSHARLDFVREKGSMSRNLRLVAPAVYPARPTKKSDATVTKGKRSGLLYRAMKAAEKAGRPASVVRFSPILLYPDLAKVLDNLPAALVLSQIDYWLSHSRHAHEGQRWCYNSLDELQQDFPFLSLSTIRRAVTFLCERGLLLVRQPRGTSDRTRWFSINYTRLGALLDGLEAAAAERKKIKRKIAEARRIRGLPKWSGFSK